MASLGSAWGGPLPLPLSLVPPSPLLCPPAPPLLQRWTQPSPCTRPPTPSPSLSSSYLPFPLQRRTPTTPCVVAGKGGENSEFALPAGSLDVASSCVQPVYRSIPRPEVRGEAEEAVRQGQVKVLFVSEGNVCRSVMAEAVLRGLVEQQGLQDSILCDSKAVRDYNVGECPEPLAVQVAAQCGVPVLASRRAKLFKPAEDIVDYDIIVVMDKFNAADVLKEVSVFDTIDPSARYSSRVRRLGDFCKSRTVEDIDDPLYGNMGGPDELENLSDALTDIQEACIGLLQDLEALRNKAAGSGVSFRESAALWLKQMDDLDWLVPPMLQKRSAN